MFIFLRRIAMKRIPCWVFLSYITQQLILNSPPSTTIPVQILNDFIVFLKLFANDQHKGFLLKRRFPVGSPSIWNTLTGVVSNNLARVGKLEACEGVWWKRQGDILELYQNTMPLYPFCMENKDSLIVMTLLTTLFWRLQNILIYLCMQWVWLWQRWTFP